MLLEEIIAAQKRGLARGIPSICSAHPSVLKEALRLAKSMGPCLIEPTCNQVNQYGGYTGMTPAGFVRHVRALADEVQLPSGGILLGGDHLGPSPWQGEPSDSAMHRAAVLVRDYAQAGFIKLHLDCSMRLGDDPPGALAAETSARRAAELAGAAEAAHVEGTPYPRYVIGTEVPIPGGAQQAEAGVAVSAAEEVRKTIDLTRLAFQRGGLESAWERVVAIVVQPGVEFGDDFVIPYQPDRGHELSLFIESQAMIYEAHSTDYQTRGALRGLVRDHFAILKVGPALTFAFREAAFVLAMMEDELMAVGERSNLVHVLDEVMTQHPEHWIRYYRGPAAEQAFRRKFSLSDRLRYYWPDPQVQAALARLLKNLSRMPLPLSLLSQFAPRQYEQVRSGEIAPKPEALIANRVRDVLLDYEDACGRSPEAPSGKGGPGLA